MSGGKDRLDELVGQSEPASRRRGGAGRLVGGACWLYLAAALGLWLVLRLTADRWWVATVMMYGPRWIMALPLVVLVPAVWAVGRRRLVWVLAVGSGVVVGPVMGLEMPWRRILVQDGNGLHLRVLTCNIHRSWLDGVALGKLLDEADVHVVALQEWSGRHQEAAFSDGHWYTQRDGELFLASRYPIRKVQDLVTEDQKSGMAVCYEVQTPEGPVYLINLHLASPHPSLEGVLRREASAAAQVRENIARRRYEAEIVSQFASGLAVPVLLMGDFNMTTDSTIYQQYWTRFINAFSSAGAGFGYTYYTNRLLRIRIDHILAGQGWQCHRSWVGPALGSPHRPVIADLEWIGSPIGSAGD